MVFERFSDWVKADVFKRMFDAVSDDPDMDMPCWMPRLFGFTAMDRAQKGDSKPGHWQVSRRSIQAGRRLSFDEERLPWRRDPLPFDERQN